MSQPLFRRSCRAVLAALALATAGSAQAQQQSASYKFLEAVRGAKGDDVQKMLSEPGTTVINTRDFSSGEGALHIVVKRGDELYLRFLLAKGADPNLRDGKGNTPLMLAASGGQSGMIDILLSGGANVNQGNGSGETPLIRAVQRHDLAMVRTLLAAGADPDQADVLAGMSARDYAGADTRSPAIAKLIADTPRKQHRAVAGPKL